MFRKMVLVYKIETSQHWWEEKGIQNAIKAVGYQRAAHISDLPVAILFQRLKKGVDVAIVS
jgi:hypothetical protein